MDSLDYYPRPVVIFWGQSFEARTIHGNLQDIITSVPVRIQTSNWCEKANWIRHKMGEKYTGHCDQDGKHCIVLSIKNI